MTIDLDTILKILNAGGPTALILTLAYFLLQFMQGKLHSDASLKRELAAAYEVAQQHKSRADRLEEIAFRLADLGERLGEAGKAMAEKIPAKTGHFTQPS